MRLLHWMLARCTLVQAFSSALVARRAMQEKEAVQRKKRAECRAKAKAEKVSLIKRPAYVKTCMSAN